MTWMNPPAELQPKQLSREGVPDDAKELQLLQLVPVT